MSAKHNAEGVPAEPEEFIEPGASLGQWQNDHSSHDASLHLHSARQDLGINQGTYGTSAHKHSREHSVPVLPDNIVRVKYERWPSASETVTTESALPSEDTTECGDDDNDASKLKGVRWPGMGLFDSANEDQKRKRNQRKDESVLKHMEKTSRSVEPTEFVWTADSELQFQRTRGIYDSPSIEGSPVRLLHRLCLFIFS